MHALGRLKKVAFGVLCNRARLQSWPISRLFLSSRAAFRPRRICCSDFFSSLPDVAASAVNPEDDFRALNYPALEAEFALLKQLDIDARPELAFPPPIASTEVRVEPAPVKKLPRGVKIPKLHGEILARDA